MSLCLCVLCVFLCLCLDNKANVPKSYLIIKYTNIVIPCIMSIKTGLAYNDLGTYTAVGKVYSTAC